MVDYGGVRVFRWLGHLGLRAVHRQCAGAGSFRHCCQAYRLGPPGLLAASSSRCQARGRGGAGRCSGVCSWQGWVRVRGGGLVCVRVCPWGVGSGLRLCPLSASFLFRASSMLLPRALRTSRTTRHTLSHCFWHPSPLLAAGPGGLLRAGGCWVSHFYARLACF